VERATEILAAYDAEMRRTPVPSPGCRVERVGSIVRVVGSDNCVIYSELTEADARPAVAAQVDHFTSIGADVEWKVFGHDTPRDLDTVLASAGFVPDEPETLLVFDLRDRTPDSAANPAISVAGLTDPSQLGVAVAVSNAAFEREDPEAARRFASALQDPSQMLFLAFASTTPVATGRLELTPGRSFAGLWGGGTLPDYRRKGVYRALVAHRAAVARERGYRFLTVDARETSRPILERLGFVPLTTTRGWVFHPGGSRPDAATTAV
jgi:GNAT superfamily N-acetyltransferase